MKHVLTPLILLSLVLGADFTNNGATLTIDAGVSITADGSFENASGTVSNSGILEITGDLLNSASFNSQSASTIKLNGGNQSFFSGSYKNLIIEGGGIKTMLGDVTINGVLTLNSGTVDLNGNTLTVNGNILYDGGSISGEGTLDGAPTISSVSLTADNSTIAVTFSEAVYSTSSGSGSLETSDFTFSISGGTGALSSSTPTSISANGNTYTLGIGLSGTPNGSETLTVTPAENAIYDVGGNAANTTQTNNTITLNNMSNLLRVDDDAVVAGDTF